MISIRSATIVDAITVAKLVHSLLTEIRPEGTSPPELAKVQCSFSRPNSYMGFSCGIC